MANDTLSRHSQDNLKPLVTSALLLALALCLPFLTGQVPQVGNLLLPMHFPVFLCGLVCNRKYGAAVGFLAPLLRHLLFGMPLLPNALAMAFELAAYGWFSGFVLSLFRKHSFAAVYAALIAAMVAGRLVWGVAAAVIFTVFGNPFGFSLFLTQAFAKAVVGIVLQLLFIPPTVSLLRQIGIAQ